MNLVKEFLLLKAKVDKLYCQLIAKSPDEQDPTVPNHVKTIKQEDIDNWNTVEDIKVQITEDTDFAEIGQNQKDFNANVANAISNQSDELDTLNGLNFEMDIPNQKLILKNGKSETLTETSVAFLNDEAKHLEYDGNGNLILKNEQGNTLSTLSVASFIKQYGKSLFLDGYELELRDENNNVLSSISLEIDSIAGLSDYVEFTNSNITNNNERINNLEGINYIWSPTNRTLTLFNGDGFQLSQVSLVSLDNEGTDLRYNASTLSLALYNADNELLDSIPVSSFIGSVGTQLQLNSNQLQLKDSQGNILSTVIFTISNVNGLQAALDSKLNKPISTGNTTSHPFVIGEDGNGNSARLPAGDLGKNFFNSDLSNTTARTHTMNAGVTVKTLGNPHTLSGLPNKNADIANFRKVRVQNASGLDAVVDSKSMLLDMPSYLTEQERTNWKTAMNGGWTTNTMSVALISPFIIKNDNNVNWILLKGANLNLPPTSFEVAIMNEEGTSVLAIVPNSQVQLYTNGTDLIFYYNFFTLGLGKYKIRLWNGVAYYITNSKLTVTDTITNIPFQQGEIRLVSGSSSINVATAYEVILKPDPNIKAQPTNSLNSLTDIVSNWVDGNVLQGNEDWWVQLSVECVVKSNWFSRLDIANVGLSSSSSSFLLSPIVGGILIYNQPTQDTRDSDIGIIGGNVLNDLANDSQINYIKVGSILQILIIASNGTVVSSTTTIDTSQNYRLVANCNNQPTNTQLNYHEGIKLTKVRISNI